MFINGKRYSPFSTTRQKQNRLTALPFYIKPRKTKPDKNRALILCIKDKIPYVLALYLHDKFSKLTPEAKSSAQSAARFNAGRITAFSSAGIFIRT